MEIEAKKERYGTNTAQVGDMLKRAGPDAACRAVEEKEYNFKISVFQNMAPCSLVSFFRGTLNLHL